MNFSNLLEFLKSIDYKGIVAEYVIHNIFDIAIKRVNRVFQDKQEQINSIVKRSIHISEYENYLTEYNLEISEKILIRSIVENIKKSETWSKEVYFNLAINNKSLSRVFVELNLYLSPLKFRYDKEEILDTKESNDILYNIGEENVIILGGPGAGKTTLVKNVFSHYNELKSKKRKYTYPFVLRFRELNYPKPTDVNYKEFGLYSILAKEFGIIIKYPKKYIKFIENEYHQLLKLVVHEFVDSSQMLLIFDGFDEIPSIELKKRIEKDFHELALVLRKSRFILTSRNGELVLRYPNTHTYEICPLTSNQIKLLATNWLENEGEANEVYNQIKSSSYYDATMRPLTLSHLCAIYERRKQIPSTPRDVYKIIIHLLIEKWDEERGIHRPSAYTMFYTDKKIDFLSHISFWISYNLKEAQFTSSNLRKCYNQIHNIYSLPPSQAKKVVTEIESHNGLLIQSGHDMYQFTHKSLQEYLTAKYLIRLGRIPDSKILKELPAETAITISLSSNPNDFFTYFLSHIRDFDIDYWVSMFTRLVEEKPDFTDNPSVIVFFLRMLEIDKENVSIIKSLLYKLISSTNVSISITNLFRTYTRAQEFKYEVILTHKDLNISLKARDYLPGTIHVDKRIYDHITSYN